MYAHFDEGAETREGLVYGIVHYFEHAVVQAPLVGVADVHVGTFSDAFQALELLDFRRVVIVVCLIRFSHFRCLF